MDRETYEAIRKTLDKKWLPLLKGEHTFETKCTLCTKFRVGTSICIECPIKLKSGSVNCNNTPFQEFCVHQDIDHNHSLYTYHRVRGCEKCLDIIGREVALLESLLPTNIPLKVEKFQEKRIVDRRDIPNRGYVGRRQVSTRMNRRTCNRCCRRVNKQSGRRYIHNERRNPTKEN